MENENQTVFIPSTIDLNQICSSKLSFYRIKKMFKDGLNLDYSKRKEPATLILNNVSREMTIGRIFLNLLLIEPFVKNRCRIKR